MSAQRYERPCAVRLGRHDDFQFIAELPQQIDQVPRCKAISTLGIEHQGDLLSHADGIEVINYQLVNVAAYLSFEARTIARYVDKNSALTFTFKGSHQPSALFECVKVSKAPIRHLALFYTWMA